MRDTMVILTVGLAPGCLGDLFNFGGDPDQDSHADRTDTSTLDDTGSVPTDDTGPADPLVTGRWVGPCASNATATATTTFALDSTLELVEDPVGMVTGSWLFVQLAYYGTFTTTKPGGGSVSGTHEGDDVRLTAEIETFSGSTTSFPGTIGFDLTHAGDEMTGELRVSYGPQALVLACDLVR